MSDRTCQDDIKPNTSDGTVQWKSKLYITAVIDVM